MCLQILIHYGESTVWVTTLLAQNHKSGEDEGAHHLAQKMDFFDYSLHGRYDYES